MAENFPEKLWLDLASEAVFGDDPKAAITIGPALITRVARALLLANHDGWRDGMANAMKMLDKAVAESTKGKK